MSSSYWVKWPVALLDDPDVARLPDSAWRRYSEAFLLAKDDENPARPDLCGFLPDVSRAAWKLHLDDEILADDFARLALAGLMELRPHPEGGERWFLTHYAETQRAATPAERMREYRRRGPVVTKSNGSVTKSKSKSKSKEQEERQQQAPREQTAAAEPALPAAAALPPDFLKMLAGHGISAGKAARRLWDAGLRAADAELVARHFQVAATRGEGPGLVITRLLNREPPPGASKNGRGRPSLGNQVPPGYEDVVQR